ncbi:hypothetical protein MMC22_001131 [Lobaria immixta]|nr:hypothetical protein [Lobaria immixta]
MAATLSSEVDLGADRGHAIIRYTTAVAVLATVIVIARLISKRLHKTNWNSSDYTVVLGLAGCWGMTGIVIRSVSYGLGKHVQVVPLENITNILKITFASEVIYSITFPVIKISILLLYRSLFPGRGFATITNAIGLMVIAWGVALLLVSIFSCRPVNGFWDITIPSVCINTRSFFIGNSVPNICADVFILVLPVRKVWHLKMSLKSKIMVSGLFLLGGFVCVVSGVRLYFLLALDQNDISWSYYGVAVWSVVEVNVAVISACLPTLRPLFQSVGRTLTSFGSSFSGNEKRSWAVGVFKNFKSSGNVSTSSLKEGNAFQRLPEYPLGHMPKSKPGDSGESNLE